MKRSRLVVLVLSVSVIVALGIGWLLWAKDRVDPEAKEYASAVMQAVNEQDHAKLTGLLRNQAGAETLLKDLGGGNVTVGQISPSGSIYLITLRNPARSAESVVYASKDPDGKWSGNVP